jgi:hypothetical protein
MRTSLTVLAGSSTSRESGLDSRRTPQRDKPARLMVIGQSEFEGGRCSRSAALVFPSTDNVPAIDRIPTLPV